MQRRIRSFPTWPSYSKEEISAVSNVLKSNQVNYWTGAQCRDFEKEFCTWTGSKHSIALSNGTVALDLALRALDLNQTDEVIVTPRSFIASVSSVITVGAKPVFADVDLQTGNLTAETINKKITKKTKAIICVHLGGLPCEMDQIMKLARKNNIFVIEDCAQAHGAEYKGKSVGTIGDIGAWSFCQDKIMTTGGEGGMITTNSKSLWKKMWAYKDHGKNYNIVHKENTSNSFQWLHDSFGSNLRMTEMQGTLGRLQIRKMPKWNKIRRRNAQILEETFKEFPNLLNLSPVPKHMKHAYYRVYAYINDVALKKSWSRDKIVQEINVKGVPCFTGSCPEIYLEKAFLGSKFKPSKRLKNAKILGQSSISFLCHPSLRISDLNNMTKVIYETLRESSI